ncbi:9209_t:CDS:2 [Acaulospora colombiana]|uniref:9209_t:CDS:1 n=1 Tax=Acaulospora colombiana TaxID=27376 RepID=A0ACA9NPQ5_9GLOM|nr:9209_t:CDS:2 [Acaulospora colombiana]
MPEIQRVCECLHPPLSGKSRRHPHLGLLPYGGEAHDGCLGIGQNRVPLIDQNEGNEGKCKSSLGIPAASAHARLVITKRFPLDILFLIIFRCLQTRKFRFPTVLRMDMVPCGCSRTSQLVLPLVFLSFAELLDEGVHIYLASSDIKSISFSLPAMKDI